MTREEAIRILDPETMGETLAEVEYYGGFRGMTKAANALYDACALAVTALQRQEERETPKPLRLDELREMDGEPVWIKAKHFGVYADIVHFIGKEDGTRFLRFKINYRLQENGYGNTWIAYRHKPKGE